MTTLDNCAVMLQELVEPVGALGAFAQDAGWAVEDFVNALKEVGE